MASKHELKNRGKPHVEVTNLMDLTDESLEQLFESNESEIRYYDSAAKGAAQHRRVGGSEEQFARTVNKDIVPHRTGRMRLRQAILAEKQRRKGY